MTGQPTDIYGRTASQRGQMISLRLGGSEASTTKTRPQSQTSKRDGEEDGDEMASARSNAEVEDDSASSSSSSSTVPPQVPPLKLRPHTAPSQSGSARSKSGGKRTSSQALFDPSEVGAVLAPEQLMLINKIVSITPRLRGHNMLWAADGYQLVFGARQLIVCMDMVSGRQRYLEGHTATVNTLALSPHG